MSRKSKGRLAREQKIGKREENHKNKILADPYFRNLTLPQQLQLTHFITQTVEEQLRLAEVAGYEKGMVETIACVVEVLLEDYWKKTGEKRITPFISDVCSLLDSVLRDVVTWQEMIQYIKDKTGINMDTDWMGEDPRPTPGKLFRRENA